MLGLVALLAGRGAAAQSDTTAAARASASGLAGANGPLLDAPVNRATYRLGPGDVLDVAILGDLERVYQLAVTPEGTLLVPSVGVVKVLGLSLDAAEARLGDAVFRYFRNVEVRVALARVREFKVFLVGNVPDPGVRSANAATRVSEIVPAGGVGALGRRNVLLRRSGGDSLLVDLVRFRQTGDLRANPTLREGDAIVVSTVDETVSITGRVQFPGTYEYRAGESLAELLSIANGGGEFPSNAADSLRLTRFLDPQRRETMVLSRAEAVSARGATLVMQPFDAIYIPELANYKEQHSATVQGQVRRPGVYPIRADTTTVRELVQLAGGLLDDASLADATLRRRPIGSGAEGLRDLNSVPNDLLTAEERRIRQIRLSGGEDNVVVDFRRLFSAELPVYDQPLRSDDVLTIPRRRDDVVILGAVVRPGVVPYGAARGVSDYVRLASGYGRRADRGNIAVLKAGRGVPTDATDVKSIDPGDTIIVPFRERVDWLRRLQTISSVVTTVSGVVLAIATLRALRRG